MDLKFEKVMKYWILESDSRQMPTISLHFLSFRSIFQDEENSKNTNNYKLVSCCKISSSCVWLGVDKLLIAYFTSFKQLWVIFIYFRPVSLSSCVYFLVPIWSNTVNGSLQYFIGPLFFGPILYVNRFKKALLFCQKNDGKQKI